MDPALTHAHDHQAPHGSRPETSDIGLDRRRGSGAIVGAIPGGMSGARAVLTLTLEPRGRGGGVGAAALCGGGGQGDALILRFHTE